MQDTQKLELEKVVSSIALFCIGVCFIVWADQVTDWIAIFLGVVSLVYSIVKFIIFLKATPERRTTFSLFCIVLAFAAGLLLVSRASFIKEAISFIIGVYIVLTSAVRILNLSDLRHRLGSAVGSYLWPVIGVVIGFLCISGQFIIPNELARLTGVGLVIYSVVYLVSFFAVKSALKTTEEALGKTLKIQEGEIVSEEKSSKKKSKK
ncbi:DUF308 domain-containing protein [Candidatus Saccharibacteria bacterium]|nr:DUF308 domain-containing protein [Candidatus Saccharibacteria bacterium]